MWTYITGMGIISASYKLVSVQFYVERIPYVVGYEEKQIAITIIVLLLFAIALMNGLREGILHIFFFRFV